MNRKYSRTPSLLDIDWSPRSSVARSSAPNEDPVGKNMRLGDPKCAVVDHWRMLRVLFRRALNTARVLDNARDRSGQQILNHLNQPLRIGEGKAGRGSLAS
jgi:hypothetical protein